MARLYPALIILVLIACPLYRFGPAGTGVGPAVSIVVTYLTDLWLWRTAQPLSVLGHTWSLAVEEHFYLLWPLIFVMIRSRRLLMALVAVLALCSLAAMVTSQAWIMSAPSGYYLPHTRAWELLAGCLVALLFRHCGTRAARLAGWAGAVALLTCLVVADRLGLSSSWVLSLQTLGVVASTVPLIIACHSRSVVSRFLSVRWLVWSGERSYGLYLFHPAMVMAASLLGVRHAIGMALAAAGTFTVSAISYRFVERPVRRLAIGWVRRKETLDVSALDVIHGGQDVHVRSSAG
jgi:peptidoglycan/LPS O-acetylase OafA/YrhL